MSNFFPQDMVYDGDTYSTSEHAFQAAKCVNRVDKDKIINAETPTKAKAVGGKVQLRSDWEQVKDSVMEDVLKAKFSDAKLREQLNNTKGSELVEGNWWHDQYWGTCSCERHNDTPGKNMLGILLMKVRDGQ